VRAYNVAGEQIATYAATGAMLTAAGQTNANLPVTPTTFSFAAGVWTANVTVTVADPAVVLTASSGAASASCNAFAVQAGAVASFTWGTASSPQITNFPFSQTMTAKDAYGNVATGFNGNVTLSGLVWSTVPQTMLGTPNYTNTSSGNWTEGYLFTPSGDFQVTAVRSFFGTRVSIWTDTGTLLASQPVSGINGTWAETKLTTPITLKAGTPYRVATYTTGQTTYYSTALSATTPIGTILQSIYASGDAYPTGYDSARW
jgi:hypothetical protein